MPPSQPMLLMRAPRWASQLARRGAGGPRPQRRIRRPTRQSGAQGAAEGRTERVRGSSCGSRSLASHRPGRTPAEPAAATWSRRTTPPSSSTAATASSPSCACFVDYVDVDAVAISHLHADHFLDLVPYSYALTYAPRQQPVRSTAGRGPTTRRRPRLIAPRGAAQDLPPGRRRLGQRRPDRERLRPRGVRARATTVEVGPVRLRFHEVPHFTETFAIDITPPRRRPHHLRRRLPPRRGADRDRPRHRPADRRGDAAAARADRRARPSDADRGRGARRLAGAKRVVLTHISDELDADQARERAAEAFGGAGRGRPRGRRLRGLSRARDLRAPAIVS